MPFPFQNIKQRMVMMKKRCRRILAAGLASVLAASSAVAVSAESSPAATLDEVVSALHNSDVQYNRLDRIVVRLDPSDSVRSVTIAVKKGTASSPTKIVPLTRVTNGIWELSLAQVWVYANSTEIKQSAIIDERANTDVCGWVTGLIDQLDTTNLFAQYDAAFKDFMEDLKSKSPTD